MDLINLNLLMSPVTLFDRIYLSYETPHEIIMEIIYVYLSARNILTWLNWY